MKPTLQLQQGLQLSMTPQLQQAIHLLQLSTLALQTEIQNVLDTNPLLEEEDSSENEQVTFENKLSANAPSTSRKTNDKRDDFLAQRPSETTLQDHLFWQMELTPFSDCDKLIASAIIEGVNEDGFLEVPLEDIQTFLNHNQSQDITLQEIEAVLHRIQQFDPIGVGARQLSECLAIQLKHFPEDLPYRDKSLTLVTDYLPLLGKRDYASLRRQLNVSLEALRDMIRDIQSLNPKPGTTLQARQPDYVIPDVLTQNTQGKWLVALNPQSTPKLKVNEYYANLISKADTSSENQFLRHQLQEAKWFLNSLDTRHDTLLKVSKCLVKNQEEFLENGEEAMNPLNLQDVAKDVNLHESTISRVITQKYMQTPRGTFELKYFFSRKISTQSNQTRSTTAMRALLKKCILEEDKANPLSDNQLVEKMAQQGIMVARRTITKYREAMMISSSHIRKQVI